MPNTEVKPRQTPQSAVDWLYHELTHTWYDSKSGLELLRQAKEMEKQQLIDFGNDAYEYALSDWRMSKTVGEELYNETYA